MKLKKRWLVLQKKVIAQFDKLNSEQIKKWLEECNRNDLLLVCTAYHLENTTKRLYEELNEFGELIAKKRIYGSDLNYFELVDDKYAIIIFSRAFQSGFWKMVCQGEITWKDIYGKTDDDKKKNFVSKIIAKHQIYVEADKSKSEKMMKIFLSSNNVDNETKAAVAIKLYKEKGSGFLGLVGKGIINEDLYNKYGGPKLNFYEAIKTKLNVYPNETQQAIIKKIADSQHVEQKVKKELAVDYKDIQGSDFLRNVANGKITASDFGDNADVFVKAIVNKLYTYGYWTRNGCMRKILSSPAVDENLKSLLPIYISAKKQFGNLDSKEAQEFITEGKKKIDYQGRSAFEL